MNQKPAPANRAKLSVIILDVAEKALAKPQKECSGEAILSALVLAHVAWNRLVSPIRADMDTQYPLILRDIQKRNPHCLRELKSNDYESLIQELMKIKQAKYPADGRIIFVCGVNEKNNVHVEWADPENLPDKPWLPGAN